MCLTVHDLPPAATEDLGKRAMTQVLVLRGETPRWGQLKVASMSSQKGSALASTLGTLTHSRLSAGIVWKLSCVSAQQDGEQPGAGAGVQPLRTTIKLDFSGWQESRGQRQRFPRFRLLILSLGRPQKSLLRFRLGADLTSIGFPPGHHGLCQPGHHRGETCPSRGSP